jgi:hypothetical protein
MGSGSGILCAPCASNNDCASGALCIVRGGSSPDAAPSSDAGVSASGFCGHACQTDGDCPVGFTCTELGSSKQCLPNTATCY